MTTGIKDWSVTPGDNNSPPPGGAPEGMPPSAVNDCIRQNMAEVRKWYEDAVWIDYGFPVSFIDADTFRISGDRTAIFTEGRRVRAIGTGYTLYGVVTSAAFTTPNTDINVTWDTGSLDNTVTSICVSQITTDGKPIHTDSIQFGDDSVPTDALDPDFVAEVTAATGRGLPAGSIFAFAGQTAPTGSLECDGASYVRTDHSDLFTAIGTTFGSVDGTHFNVPDLRGEFIRGWDHGRGIDISRAFGTNQADAFKTHTHPLGGNLLDVAAPGTLYNGPGGAGTVKTTTSATGDVETRPVNVALMYCIKT